MQAQQQPLQDSFILIWHDGTGHLDTQMQQITLKILEEHTQQAEKALPLLHMVEDMDSLLDVLLMVIRILEVKSIVDR